VQQHVSYEFIWIRMACDYIQRGPKKVSHHQFFKKIALKIANEIRFLRTVKV